MKKTLPVILLGLLMTLSACEKAVIDDIGGTEEPPVENGVKLKIAIGEFEQVPFSEQSPTRAATDVKDVCTRISFAIYKSDGSVYDIKNQQRSDNGFGSLSITLPKGDYRLVVIAHNGLGTPTFDSSDKVKFKDNKVTDTFFCVQDITLDENKEYTLKLKRAVAMFRLVMTDEMPDNVKQMKFYYTGGSSTFGPETGYGVVKSRQTEIREVSDAMHGKPCTFEVYTFPHAEEDVIKVTVSALDASGNKLMEKVFNEVPVKRSYISQYRGAFFSSSPGGDDDGKITLSLLVDDDWTEIDHSY